MILYCVIYFINKAGGENINGIGYNYEIRRQAILIPKADLY